MKMFPIPETFVARDTVTLPHRSVLGFANVQINNSRIPIGGKRLMGHCFSVVQRRATTPEGDMRSAEASALILNMHWPRVLGRSRRRNPCKRLTAADCTKN